VLVFHIDVEFGGADAAALHFLEPDGGADFERGDGGGDGGLVGAGVGQRADKHVAADAGEGVQVAGQRHVSFMVAQAVGVMREVGFVLGSFGGGDGSRGFSLCELVGSFCVFMVGGWNGTGPASLSLRLGGSTAVYGLRCFPGRDVGIKGNIGRSFA